MNDLPSQSGDSHSQSALIDYPIKILVEGLLILYARALLPIEEERL